MNSMACEYYLTADVMEKTHTNTQYMSGTGVSTCPEEVNKLI